MRNITDIAVGVLTLLFCLLGFWGTTSTGNIAGTTDPIGPIAFPRAILGMLAVLGLAQTWRGFRAKKEKRYWPAAPVMKKTGCFFLLFFLYVAMVIYFGELFTRLDVAGLPQGMGFIVSTEIYLIAALLLAGRRNALEIGLVAVLIPTSVTVSFAYFFQIAMP